MLSSLVRLQDPSPLSHVYYQVQWALVKLPVVCDDNALTWRELAPWHGSGRHPGAHGRVLPPELPHGGVKSTPHTLRPARASPLCSARFTPPTGRFGAAGAKGRTSGGGQNAASAP